MLLGYISGFFNANGTFTRFFLPFKEVHLRQLKLVKIKKGKVRIIQVKLTMMKILN